MTEAILGFLFSYASTLVFIGLKWGFLLRDGCLYKWSGDIPHTLIFLIVVAIDSIKFLFILRWKYRCFNG